MATTENPEAKTIYSNHYRREVCRLPNPDQNIKTNSLSKFLQLLCQKYRNSAYGFRYDDFNRIRVDGLQQYSRYWRKITYQSLAYSTSKRDECNDVIAWGDWTCKNKHRGHLQNDGSEDIRIRNIRRSGACTREHCFVLWSEKNFERTQISLIFAPNTM